MRIVFGFGLMLILALVRVSPVQAYSLETGNRALDIAGWDIVHQRSVCLSDYLGRWVLVEFSAMWCGPCKRALPALLEQTKPFRDSGELAVVMVSCDTPKTLSKAKSMIKKNHIDFPVLYDGGQFKSTPVVEWCKGDTLCFGIPTTALIDPQGVVVAVKLSKANLASELDFYMREPRPVLAYRSYHCKNGDGSYTFFVDMVNPGRQPVEVAMDFYWEEWQCDPQDPARRATDNQDHREKDCARSTLTFDEFGEASYSYTVTPTASQDIIGYMFRMVYPGSQGAPGIGETGVELATGHYQAFSPGIEWTGEYHRVLLD